MVFTKGKGEQNASYVYIAELLYVPCCPHCSAVSSGLLLSVLFDMSQRYLKR